MGCHTWFYKPSKVSLEKAKEKALKCFKETKSQLDKVEIEFTEKYFDELFVWRDWYDYATTEMYYIDERVWIQDNNLPHDLFRTKGGVKYTGQVLKSLQETLEFIKQYELEISDLYLLKLKAFWKEYPNGLIRFG